MTDRKDPRFLTMRFPWNALKTATGKRSVFQYMSSAPTGGSLARLSAMASSVGMVSVILPLLYFSYATMSKYPVPVSPNRIVFSSPVSRQRMASSMAARMA